MCGKNTEKDIKNINDQHNFGLVLEDLTIAGGWEDKWPRKIMGEKALDSAAAAL